MVHHIVMWNLNTDLSEVEKAAAGKKLKEILEGLPEVIETLDTAKVVLNEAGTSNRDVALFTTMKSFDALQQYLGHPKHVEAGKYVRSVTCDRACIDYEE